MLVDTGRRTARRVFWTVVLGFFLGGVLTHIARNFLPDSAARSFLTTSVRASVGPVSMDLVAVAFTLGPFSVYMNVLTVVGVFIVALVARSWI
ncbi:MAG: hypothetical protein RQ751_08475 [Longimicrobiales bacterium]|nr:hypothetical protein [Longimicrobiales bacterium]